MNKLLTFLILLATSLGSIAQDTEYFNEVFNRFANRKDAFSISLNKNMIDAVDLDFDWKREIKHVSGDIMKLKLIVFDEDDNGMGIVKSFSSQILNAGYPELDVDIEEDREIKYLKIFGKKVNGFYRDIHVLVLDDDDRAYFFSVNGKLKIKTEV